MMGREIMVRYFQSMSESLNISHKSAALTFICTIIIDYDGIHILYNNFFYKFLVVFI